MRNAFSAVLNGLRYRPSVWLVCGLGWVLYGTFSAKGIPYILYRTGDPSYRGQLLPGLLPAALPGAILGAYPLFGAIFMVALGGLAIGNEYRWGTLGTLFVQHPSRPVLLGAQAAALAVVTLVTTLLYTLFNGIAAVAVGAGVGAALTLPGALPLLAAVAGSWLVAFVYAMIGAFVAHLFRSAVAAVVAAIVLVIGVENVVGLLAGLVPGLTAVEQVLPGPSSGSLAAAAGAMKGTPGVTDVSPPALAVIVLMSWAALCIAGSIAVVRNRDITA